MRAPDRAHGRYRALRRPTIVALALVLAVLGCAPTPGQRAPAPDDAVTAGRAAPDLLILVRHAEANYDPGGDPGLTVAGLERAERLAALLRDAGITAIHTTDSRRTRSTAAPIATAVGLEPVVYDGRALAAVADRLMRAGGRHLVVGHSNTTPELAALLGGDPGPAIDSAEHDRVYLLLLERGVGGGGGAVRTVVLRY